MSGADSFLRHVLREVSHTDIVQGIVFFGWGEVIYILNMSDLVQLVQIGRGLQDEALREFVSTKNVRLQDERQSEREAVREKEER